ncbi:unnamed protein product [Acanthosepion pharaonis]|uniref:Uncharacterized protein n=1 Tax=Acanthosepion pharaonis TaxID=158019 RepID=A0A812BMA9_ACAPH|nr:unnamed protein product [Sepia pharaonis]
MAASRRESYPRFMNQSTAIRPNSTVDITCQMTPGLQNGEKNTLMTPYCPTWRSTLSSHADSGHGWSEGDTGHAEEMTDQLIPQFCKPQSGQFNKMDKRHIEGNFSYPNESTTIPAICFSKATSNPINLLRKETEQKSHHLSDSIQITHNARPLPPVPHKIH